MSPSHIPDTGTPLPCQDVQGSDIQARCVEPAWIGTAGAGPELIRLVRPELTPAARSTGSQGLPSPAARRGGTHSSEQLGSSRSPTPARPEPCRPAWVVQTALPRTHSTSCLPFPELPWALAGNSELSTSEILF